MDYLDNPERRSAGRLSDDASANHHGFGPAITHDAVPGRAVPDLDVWAALTSPSQFGGKGLPMATSGDGFSPSGRSARVSANGLAPALSWVLLIIAWRGAS